MRTVSSCYRHETRACILWSEKGWNLKTKPRSNSWSTAQIFLAAVLHALFSWPQPRITWDMAWRETQSQAGFPTNPTSSSQLPPCPQAHLHHLHFHPRESPGCFLWSPAGRTWTIESVALIPPGVPGREQAKVLSAKRLTHTRQPFPWCWQIAI